MNAHNCCDHKRIDAFLKSSNNQTTYEASLSRHLEDCAVCREYMQRQAASPEIWRHASELLRPQPFDCAGDAEYSAATVGYQRCEQPVAIQSVLDLLTPSEDPSRLGRLGGYEISGVVGAGGMGIVLKAIDPSLDRVVAVKVMSPHLANNGTARKRFSREAKAAAAVLHPNVVPIHCVSSDEVVPFLVMAFIRGGSLQKRLQREGPLATIEILRIGSQIAAGLAAAHEKGLVHRDIKPENIMLEEGIERVTITDFGLARAVDDASLTRDGAIAGTPQYMSPEQARGESVDQRSDLFSLGSVLYAMCTGRPPFRAESSFGVMRRISDETPIPIRELNPDIPAYLETMVDRLMEKKRADRLDSAQQVQALLDACLSHAQQPASVLLPPTLNVATPAVKSPTAKMPTSRTVRQKWRNILLSLLGGITLVLAGWGAVKWLPELTAYVTREPAPIAAGGGAASRANGWFVLDGSLYVDEHEPGLMLGGFENPAGKKGFTYVVLFRHRVHEKATVVRTLDSRLKFDGNVGSSRSGVNVAGFEFVLDQDFRVDSETMTSATITLNGRRFDPAKGRLFLVDLTRAGGEFRQVNVGLSAIPLDPQELTQDPANVTRLAKQLTRQFSTENREVEAFLQSRNGGGSMN